MASALHLQQRHRRVIESLARRHLPNVEIWAYGSRVNGQSHDGSDLDLVLRGANLAELPPLQVGAFGEALQESTLPFLVEARDWACLPERFHGEIERSYVTLVSAESRWRNVTLGDCAVLVRDSVTPSTCPDLPYIGLEHIGQGSLLLNGIGRARDVESTKTAFRAGDILFGKLRPYFRKVVRPRFDGICSTDIWVFRPKEHVDAGFLFYLLASPAFADFATQGAEGTRMPRAKWEQVSRLPARLPPVPEQRVIAHVLGALDDKIELNRRMAKTLDEAVRAVFKSWFVDFDPVRHKAQKDGVALSPEILALFPGRFIESDVGDIPDGWEVQSLGDLVEFVYGSALRSDERNGGSIPVFGSNGQVGWHDKRLVKGPGVIVGRKGNPGVITWSQGDFFPIDTTFYVVPKGNMSMRFLFFALSHQNLPSIAADSAVPGLNRNIAYMNRQLVPSAAVMRTFDSQADAMLSRIARNKDEANTLAGLRDALLRKLVSGEIRIQEAEKIVGAKT